MEVILTNTTTTGTSNALALPATRSNAEMMQSSRDLLPAIAAKPGVAA